jgi:hypothetical protein
LRKSFAERTWRVPFNALPVVQEQGLVLGHGSILARMGCNRQDEEILMLDRDEARLLALLSAVYGSQISPRVMHYVSRASEQWRRGDKVLANIELAYARFPRLETKDDSFRLYLAEDLLARGMSPKHLTRALGFDPNLLKYDPNQPRVPAGSGRPSGRWVKVGDEASPTDSASAASETVAVAASILEGTAPTALRWLSSFAAQATGAGALGALAFAGFMVLPTPNSGGVYEGDVPTFPGVRYKFSEPTGELQITAKADDGSTITVQGHTRGDTSLYYDEKGRLLGRDVGTGLYIDLDAADAAIREELGAPPRDDQQDEPESTLAPFIRPDEPKLCPEPSKDPRGFKDDPNGEKDFAALYQEYIGSRINPQIQPPLPATLGYALFNPQSGKFVVFDHCQLTTGLMVDAKAHYESVLSFSIGRDSVRDEFLANARKQIQAADSNGGHPIEWDFYEEATLEFARETFKQDETLARIKLVQRDYPGDDEWPYPQKAQRSWARGRQRQ